MAGVAAAGVTAEGAAAGGAGRWKRLRRWLWWWGGAARLFSRRGRREARSVVRSLRASSASALSLRAELAAATAALGISPDCYFVVHRSEQA